jgi:hypothetical protein
MKNNKEKSFFCKQEVKQSKSRLLKTRLQTLINDKGMSEADFYNKLGISKQYWYYISWGLWPCPLDLKIKISKELNTDSVLIWQEDEI